MENEIGGTPLWLFGERGCCAARVLYGDLMLFLRGLGLETSLQHFRRCFRSLRNGTDFGSELEEAVQLGGIGIRVIDDRGGMTIFWW